MLPTHPFEKRGAFFFSLDVIGGVAANRYRKSVAD